MKPTFQAKLPHLTRKTMATVTLIGGLVLSLILLSDLSTYTQEGVEKMDFDLLLMLTPYGIVRFLILNPYHWLHDYYFSIAPRHGIFDDPRLFLLVVLLISLSLTLLKMVSPWLRRKS